MNINGNKYPNVDNLNCHLLLLTYILPHQFPDTIWADLILSRDTTRILQNYNSRIHSSKPRSYSIQLKHTLDGGYPLGKKIRHMFLLLSKWAHRNNEHFILIVLLTFDF